MKEKTVNTKKLTSIIRRWLVIFIICLAISGLTAFGIETELTYLSAFFPSEQTAMGRLLWKVYGAIKYINEVYPFLSYGYDWLAFAHIVIAIAFVGPLKNPVRNKWVIEFGLIACALVIPFALLAGALRGLPLWWRFIDCSFGIVGFIPLFICYRLIKQLEKTETIETLSKLTTSDAMTA